VVGQPLPATWKKPLPTGEYKTRDGRNAMVTEQLPTTINGTTYALLVGTIGHERVCWFPDGRRLPMDHKSPDDIIRNKRTAE
jgi:hypothetical protein